MILEYTSTLSINSYKHDIGDADGVYYTDTGYGMSFLDKIWKREIKLVAGGWEQEREYHHVQIEWGEIEEEPEETEEQIQTAKQDFIEGYIIERITKIDFHEFIHHFLNINKIDNDCCEHHDENEKEASGSGNPTYPDCWLCRFTHELLYS